MDSIILDYIRCYAHHGCLEEETAIGSDYRVDLEVFADFSKAAMSDDIEYAVDYVALHRIVVDEMAIPSKLLEHVGKRILDEIFLMNDVSKAVIAIRKINPPIGGDVESVCVKMSRCR